MTVPVEQHGKLRGQVAVISGGAQGIGRAIADRFQREGARVMLLDCDASKAEQTARELSDCRPWAPVSFVRADIGDPTEIAQAMQLVDSRHARLNILVNNAGMELDKSLVQLSVCDWDQVMNVNLRGAFLLSQSALPLFPDTGGAIVNISSIHATHAFPNSIAYACSKAGLLALTRNLALEMAPHKIRVNAICPGYIDTRLWEEYLRQSLDPTALASQTTALHPLGRRGLPEDIEEAALFLVGEGASFITGTSLVVDGGLTIRAHA
jgi:NAD(P)-dependent dehydrogenase (short-subunit alcohol dehydrogenase family)